MSTNRATGRHRQMPAEVAPSTMNSQNDRTKRLSEEKILEEDLDSGRRISPYRETKTAKEFWRHIWNGLTLGYLRD